MAAMISAAAVAVQAATPPIQADDHLHAEQEHAHAHDDTNRVYPSARIMESADASAQDHGGGLSLPPLPDGVTELRFRELFKMPFGPRGLEYSEKTSSLVGRRVRMLGYMVQEDQPVPGRLLLSPFPFTLHTDEYGLAEDLPSTTVHVYVAVDPDKVVFQTPGLLLLTGVLETGPQADPDGRVSTVRVRLDPPPTETTARDHPAADVAADAVSPDHPSS